VRGERDTTGPPRPAPVPARLRTGARQSDARDADARFAVIGIGIVNSLSQRELHAKLSPGSAGNFGSANAVFSAQADPRDA